MEQYVTFVTGAIVGSLFGLMLGYMIWNRKRSDGDALSKLTWTQVIGALLLSAYLFTPNPDTAISLALIALVPSEAVGLGVAKGLEKSRKARK